MDDKHSRQKAGAFSTLAERMREKNPELMKKIEVLQRSDDSVKRVVQILDDLLPYQWVDRVALSEAIKVGIQGSYQFAIELLLGVLQRDPGAYPAHHLIGHWLGCLGDFKQEIDHYKKAIKLNPNYPQIYFDLGLAYVVHGNEKKAFASFMQSIPLAPEFTVADYWFTFSFDRLGWFRDSIKAGEKSQKDPVLAQACWMLGNAFVEHRLYSSARQAYKRAIRTQPDFAEACLQLGELHIKKLRNPERAEKYLNAAEEMFLKQVDLHRATLVHQLRCSKDEVLDKDNAGENWLKEGLRLQVLGRFQSAVDAYKVAISFKPKYLEALYNMGIAYGCLADLRTSNPREGVGEEIERAIWAFKDSIRIKPDFIHAYIGIGASYIKSKRYQEAISALQDAATFETEDATVFYYLGMAYRMSGKFPEAVEALKKAIAIKPEEEPFLFYLGLIYLDLKQYEDACEAFEESVRVKPDFADGHFMLGDLFGSQINAAEKAVFHLKKAERLYHKLEDQEQSARVRQMLTRFPE